MKSIKNNKQKQDVRYACPRCEDANCLGCDLGYYNYEFDLNKICTLKFGELSQCSDCKSHWIVIKELKRMIYVEPEKTDMVLDWNGRDLSVSAEFLKVLAKIGATPPDVYGNGKGYVFVPCKVILKDGTTIDYCLFTFQQLPPVDYWYNNKSRFVFADQVAKVEESEYALPAVVRVHTSEADEVSMSHAPSWVQAPDGSIYKLNWTNNFFDCDGFKGKDIVLPKHKCDLNTPCAFATTKFNVTYIIADWNDKYLDLNLKHTWEKKK